MHRFSFLCVVVMAALLLWACESTSSEPVLPDGDSTDIPEGDAPDNDPADPDPDPEPDVVTDGDTDPDPELDIPTELDGTETEADIPAEEPETDPELIEESEPDPDADIEPETPQGELYVSHGMPYVPGGLNVETIPLAQNEQGAPVDMLIFAPKEDGEYAVVVFQHGFLMANHYYTSVLTHLASHGFIVVVPQMYTPGGLPIGKPNAYEEALTALAVYDWLPTALSAVTGLTARHDRTGLAGHSRGGKVIWIVLKGDPSYAQAVAGVDPVDGTGGPLGGEVRVVDGDFGFGFPSFVLGTGKGSELYLGQACAPIGDNHERFYDASASPAFHVVATYYGHNDMLEDQPSGCGLECTSCPGGDSRAPMRNLTAGMLVAFFRGALQGVPSSFDTLTDIDAAPVVITAEQK